MKKEHTEVAEVATYTAMNQFWVIHLHEQLQLESPWYGQPRPLTKWHLFERSLIQFVLGDQTRSMSWRDSVSGFIRSIIRSVCTNRHG